MTPKRFDLFIKLMMLSTSDQDGEALVAIRKANAILAEDNLNWEEFIRSGVKVVHETQKQERTDRAKSSKQRKEAEEKEYHDTYRGRLYDDDSEILPMFEYLLETIPVGDSFLHFIQDVRKWYREKGFLTERQYRVIRNAYFRRQR
jgi:hypothetical protein